MLVCMGFVGMEKWVKPVMMHLYMTHIPSIVEPQDTLWKASSKAWAWKTKATKSLASFTPPAISKCLIYSSSLVGPSFGASMPIG